MRLRPAPLVHRRAPGLARYRTQLLRVVLELTSWCSRLLPGFITFWEKKFFLEPLPTLFLVNENIPGLGLRMLYEVGGAGR